MIGELNGGAIEMPVLPYTLTFSFSFFLYLATQRNRYAILVNYCEPPTLQRGILYGDSAVYEKVALGRSSLVVESTRILCHLPNTCHWFAVLVDVESGQEEW